MLNIKGVSKHYPLLCGVYEMMGVIARKFFLKLDPLETLSQRWGAAFAGDFCET
tara:strand:+ start:365 stop:526 length:162 start_codon:yes stop_codon:yes gene_type:complete